MNHSILRSVLSLTLVLLFIVACGEPAATPTVAPPAVTPTRASPTATPTPVPPTISPTQTVSYVLPSAVEEALLKGDWAAVVETLEKNDSRAEDPVTRLIMAHASLATNSNNASMLLFLSVSEESDLHLWSEWTSSFLHRNTQNPIALYLSGDAEARNGRFEGAKEAFTRALETKEDLALALNARGVVSSLLSEWNNAVTDFENATKLTPNLADAHANLGTYFVLTEAAKGALEAFNKALAINPEFALAYNGRGAAYFGDGKFEKAAHDFHTAIQISPILVVAEMNRGSAFAYTSQLIILASMESEAGTTLESLMEQYPRFLEQRQEQFSTPSLPTELLNTSFSFMPDDQLSSLVDQYGQDSVVMAMSHDLNRIEGRLAEASWRMRSEFDVPEVQAVQTLIRINMADQLTGSAFSAAFADAPAQTEGWSSYMGPRSERIGWAGWDPSFSDFPPSIEYEGSLSENILYDIAPSYLESAISSAFLPPEASIVTSIADSIAAEPARTPEEVLDRLKPISALHPIPYMDKVLDATVEWYWDRALKQFDYNRVLYQRGMYAIGHNLPTSAVIQDPFVQRPAYYLPDDQPLIDLGIQDLVSKVDLEIPPIGRMERRALIVGDPFSFESHLLQTELSRQGFETRFANPEIDPQIAAEGWAADVILGIQRPADFQPIEPRIELNWDWGQPFIPTYPREMPGGITTEELAAAFVDKGNWPVMTPFSLFYSLGFAR